MGSSRNVRIEEFAGAIREALEETKGMTEKALQVSVDKTARETVKKIKGKAPVKTGKYRSGWTSGITQQPGRGFYGRTVHNSKRYMLAHLLQHGHGGPRPAGPHPHIPSDEETAALFEQNLEKEMSK
ncbi:MAG: HK97 gp10 family phage protein [Lachnospiraceae bacterium]|nr:HK97 gp10 family phage protein [Lachnospiraceae bacterium]